MPNYCQSEDVYRHELQARIDAAGLVRWATLPRRIFDLLFSEIERIGPRLRPDYGVGQRPEEVIEFSDKLQRGSAKPLRFSFEAPVEDVPSAERLIRFVHDLGELCGLSLSGTDGIVRDAASSRRSFGQHSMFVVWFAFSFQEDLPAACKMYFNLNDRELRDSANRLNQVLTLTKRGSLFLPVLMVLYVATGRRVALRGAAVNFPGSTTLKLYFEISRDFGPETMLSLCREAGVCDMDAPAASGMRELFAKAETVLASSDALAWGLSVQYDGPPEAGPAVSRAEIYFPPPRTSMTDPMVWLNTFMPEPWNGLWQDQSPDRGSEYGGSVATDRRFQRNLGQVALGCDIRARAEINLYWTLRRSEEPDTVLSRGRSEQVVQ